MRVLIYKRHKESCPHRDEPTYKRCGCAIWLQWNLDGKQTRKSAKTRSWEMAEQKARHEEQRHVDAELGKVAPSAPATVPDAVKLFMDAKRGGGLEANTLGKYQL